MMPNGLISRTVFYKKTMIDDETTLYTGQVALQEKGTGDGAYGIKAITASPIRCIKLPRGSSIKRHTLSN